jgi:hypothetical protein
VTKRIIRWLVTASLLLAAIPSAAQGNDPAGLRAQTSFGIRAAGSYLLEVLHEGFPPAAALVTLTRDGGFLSTDVSDFGAGGLSTIDSPVHGTWKATGPRTLEATTFYFGFDEDGIPIWIARSKGQFEFDAAFRTGSGSLVVERFTFEQDPLDPSEVPADRLAATLTARRISSD